VHQCYVHDIQAVCALLVYISSFEPVYSHCVNTHCLDVFQQLIPCLGSASRLTSFFHAFRVSCFTWVFHSSPLKLNIWGKLEQVFLSPHSVTQSTDALSTECISSSPLPLPSSRHRRSYDDCLEDKRGNYQNCAVPCRVWQLCTMIHTHPSSSCS